MVSQNNTHKKMRGFIMEWSWW